MYAIPSDVTWFFWFIVVIRILKYRFQLVTSFLALFLAILLRWFLFMVVKIYTLDNLEHCFYLWLSITSIIILFPITFFVITSIWKTPLCWDFGNFFLKASIETPLICKCHSGIWKFYLFCDCNYRNWRCFMVGVLGNECFLLIVIWWKAISITL